MTVHELLKSFVGCVDLGLLFRLLLDDVANRLLLNILGYVVVARLFPPA